MGRNVPAPLDAARQPACAGWTAAPEPEPDDTAPPLGHHLWVLRRHRWKILGFVAACELATLIVSSRVTPIYESTAVIDIDRQAPAGVIGEEASRASGNDSDQFLATQIKLIQADAVLRPVAQKYKLLEREQQFQDLPQLSPARVESAPVLLRRLKVTRPPNTYLLLISYRSPDAHLAADVANAIANSYLQHTYDIRVRSSANLASYMEKELEELKAKMEASTQRLLQFERELNVINPEEKTNILSARLLQLNTEYTNAQADRVSKEAAYSAVRSGSFAAAQVSSQGEALKKLLERQNELQEKFADAQGHYGANHPEYKKAAAQVAEIERQIERARVNIAQRVETEYQEAENRERMLAAAVSETKAQFDRLNARSFEYQALKREAEGDKKVYDELVRKIKEAGINASFQNSAIRIADAARPGLKPVFPRLWLNLLVALLLSTVMGAGAAIVSDSLDKTVRDPEIAARVLNTEVLGSLPIVKNWRVRLGPVPEDDGQAKALVRAEREPLATAYREAVRALRNSILLADFDRRVHSLLVTSASPGEGKSTIAAHLALTHAAHRQKTLLIDGDLRRPSVHKRFKMPGVIGLSSVLLAEMPWRDAVLKPPGVDHLEILPAGPPSHQAAEQMEHGLMQLLDEAAQEYDLIVLDAPPLLGFAEPLEMAAAVDGVIVVTRAGQTTRKSVAAVLAILARLRANTLGLVLNEVRQDMSESYSYYRHYAKYYGDAAPRKGSAT
ncbi:MAG TPA: polysaccharide biosynthesis tyrosine autokinase [Bryobacteraceae bacterium]|nr:polysaccharide biosynthesis tyrosine autokinase [Bryobacteraceae bacterium]HUJ19905.1 polysaccharide biosynthesis tyrosine autokinase [Bryobacteraceae bacterium]